MGASLALLLHLLIFRAMPGPHPCLPPEGEGAPLPQVGDGWGEGVKHDGCAKKKNSLPRWGRVRVGANLAHAAPPAYV